MSLAKVVSCEMDFASCSGTTGRSSMPWASSHKCSPLLPKRCRSNVDGHLSQLADRVDAQLLEHLRP